MLATLATATLVGLAAAAPAADKVDVLPGFEPTNFSVYSGMYCTPGPCRCRVHVQHEDLVDPTLRNCPSLQTMRAEREAPMLPSVVAVQVVRLRSLVVLGGSSTACAFNANHRRKAGAQLSIATNATCMPFVWVGKQRKHVSAPRSMEACLSFTVWLLVDSRGWSLRMGALLFLTRIGQPPPPPSCYVQVTFRCQARSSRTRTTA